MLNECENICDLCCGAGRFTIPLLKLGRRVCATDMSKGSLEALLRRVDAEELKESSLLLPVCGLAQNIPIRDGWAGCVLFIGALQYIPVEDHNKVLLEINRCLHEGGELIMAIFYYDSLLLRLVHRLCPSRWARDGIEYGSNGFRLDYHRFTKAEIKKLLRQSGFEVISLKAYRNFPFDQLSTKLDLLIAEVGIKVFGTQLMVHARKM